MFEKLSHLAQGWLGAPLRTSLVFWLGGLFLWIINIINWENLTKLWQGNQLKTGESLITSRWQSVWEFLRNLPETEVLLLILLVLTTMILSGIFIQLIQLKILRLLEGYGLFSLLKNWRRNYYILQSQKDLTRWEELAKRENNLNPSEYEEYIDLDRKVVLTPEEKYIMPTRLGNILRGYEQRPREKYGLDSIICWARLWLLLPKETQQELINARAALDEAVQLIIWGFLFFFWIIVGWEAIIIGLILIVAGYWSALQAAETYGELIEATFDVHRHQLYKAVGWPIPTPDNEKEQGKKLTQYFWRGNRNIT